MNKLRGSPKEVLSKLENIDGKSKVDIDNSLALINGLFPNEKYFKIFLNLFRIIFKYITSN